MALSILVAKIMAVIYLSVGVAALRGMNFGKMIDDFEKSAALTYIAAVISIVLGMLLVTYHNIWVQDWPVLVTVVGWAALIKGVLLIVLPEFMSYFKGWYKNTQMWGILLLIIGAVYGYFGFVM